MSEKKYIDADLLKEYLNVFINTQPSCIDDYECGYDDCFTTVQNMIPNIPTADVAEVVRGKWIGESLECSVCQRSIREIYDAEGYMSYGIEDDLHYCPFCGAKITERI